MSEAHQRDLARGELSDYVDRTARKEENDRGEADAKKTYRIDPKARIVDAAQKAFGKMLERTNMPEGAEAGYKARRANRALNDVFDKELNGYLLDTEERHGGSRLKSMGLRLYMEETQTYSRSELDAQGKFRLTWASEYDWPVGPGAPSWNQFIDGAVNAWWNTIEREERTRAEALRAREEAQRAREEQQARAEHQHAQRGQARQPPAQQHAEPAPYQTPQHVQQRIERAQDGAAQAAGRAADVKNIREADEGQLKEQKKLNQATRDQQRVAAKLGWQQFVGGARQWWARPGYGRAALNYMTAAGAIVADKGELTADKAGQFLNQYRDRAAERRRARAQQPAAQPEQPAAQLAAEAAPQAPTQPAEGRGRRTLRRVKEYAGNGFDRLKDAVGYKGRQPPAAPAYEVPAPAGAAPAEPGPAEQAQGAQEVDVDDVFRDDEKGWIHWNRVSRRERNELTRKYGDAVRVLGKGNVYVRADMEPDAAHYIREWAAGQAQGNADAGALGTFMDMVDEDAGIEAEARADAEETNDMIRGIFDTDATYQTRAELEEAEQVREQEVIADEVGTHEHNGRNGNVDSERAAGEIGQGVVEIDVAVHPEALAEIQAAETPAPVEEGAEDAAFASDLDKLLEKKAALGAGHAEAPASEQSARLEMTLQAKEALDTLKVAREAEALGDKDAAQQLRAEAREQLSQVSGQGAERLRQAVEAKVRMDELKSGKEEKRDGLKVRKLRRLKGQGPNSLGAAFEDALTEPENKGDQ